MIVPPTTGSDLPDEIWRRILEMGLRNSNFTYKNLCCISISCRRLHRLSDEAALWYRLLSDDFAQKTPPSCSSSTPKLLYSIMFDRERKKKMAAHKRGVMRKESQAFEHLRRIREIEIRLEGETKKFKATAAELSNLHKARQASVALNVWQPEIVRSRQKQVVEQNAVPADAWLHALKMELKLCKQQIVSFTEAYRDEKEKLERVKKELESMNYHPLREHNLTSCSDGECKIKKKKKLKSNIKFPVKKVSENYDTEDLHWLPY